MKKMFAVVNIRTKEIIDVYHFSSDAQMYIIHSVNASDIYYVREVNVSFVD